MRHRRFFLAVLFVLTLPAALAQCQQVTVQGEAGKQVVLARADIEALPHMKVTSNVAATPTMFEGVSLKAVLEKA